MRHLIHALEVWQTDEEDIPVEFKCTNVLWQEDGEVYLARSPLRPSEVLLDTLRGELVPKSHIYPTNDPKFVHASDPLLAGSYIKRPLPVDYDSEAPDYGRNILNEIRVSEIIRAHPHSNLVEYRGCIEEKGYITALCLKKYGATLLQAVNDLDGLDYSRVMQDVRSGVMHLHSLGLVHNDINPANIVVDEDGRWVLIDYDSCRPDGEEFPLGSKQGTFEWSRETNTSERENDLYGLDRVDRWLREKTAK